MHSACHTHVFLCSLMNSIKYCQKKKFTDHDVSLSKFPCVCYIRYLSDYEVEQRHTQKKIGERNLYIILKREKKKKKDSNIFLAVDTILAYYPSTLIICIVTNDLSSFVLLYYLVFYQKYNNCAQYKFPSTNYFAISIEASQLIIRLNISYENVIQKEKQNLSLFYVLNTISKEIKTVIVFSSYFDLSY